jgi:glucose-6-phosphate dehydrogenase assembly protein OpcA
MEKEIEIPNIETELQKIWRSKIIGNQLKASLFNLVIYSHEPRRTEYLKGVMTNFLTKFPCRIIFIDHRRDAPTDYLKVTVSDKFPEAEQSTVSCDQIYIEVTTSLLGRVPYIILPHFVPDLPIYLIWGQDPVYEHEVLPALEQYAVRLIYDSECNHNLKIFSLKILEKMRRSKLEFMDVSWGLIGGWRDAIAECFDCDKYLEALFNSDTITIVYNAVQPDKIFHAERQAIYLQAWLASQMRWRFVQQIKDDNKITLRYNNGKHDLDVHLISDRKGELPAGQVMVFEATASNLHTSIKLQQDNPSRLIVNMSSDEECELPFIITVADPRKGTAVLKELFFQRPSQHYKEMLDYLSHIDLDI